MELSFDNFKKWSLGILGTVVLGAIGSGVWEWILSDIFSWLGSSFISFASSLSQTFVDSLYKNIWRGQNFPYLREIYVLTFAIYTAFPIMFAISSKRLENTNNTSANKKRPNLYVLAIMICATGVMMIINIWQTSFTERVASTLQANTLILTPYITSRERIELDSKFSLIDSELTAIDLKRRLEELSMKHKIKLHDMSFM